MFLINVQLLKFFGSTLIIFEKDLDFPDVTPQAGLFVFINELNNTLNILQNNILSIFTLYVSQSTEIGILNF